MPAPAQLIYIVRHAEKPIPGSYEGVNVHGVPAGESLIPKGWQRAGALARLFAPTLQQPRPGFEQQPEQLIAPEYKDKSKTENHRTYETLLPLCELTGVGIETKYKEGEEKRLGEHLCKEATVGVVLIAWEHKRIPDIVRGIGPIGNPKQIPPEWPERFDIVWVLERLSGSYYFAALPQLLLAGDAQPS